MVITSSFKFIDDIFEYLPILFFDKMVRKWINALIQLVAQLLKLNVWNKENQKMEQMYNARQ